LGEYPEGFAINAPENTFSSTISVGTDILRILLSFRNEKPTFSKEGPESHNIFLCLKQMRNIIKNISEHHTE
jgi:hypothetical protein